jgi:hypothetical protein
MFELIYALGWGLYAAVEIWLTIEGLNVITNGTRLTMVQRLLFALASGVVTFVVALGFAISSGIAWATIAVWLLKHLIELGYSFIYARQVWSMRFWKELIAPWIPERVKQVRHNPSLLIEASFWQSMHWTEMVAYLKERFGPSIEKLKSYKRMLLCNQGEN